MCRRHQTSHTVCSLLNWLVSVSEALLCHNRDFHPLPGCVVTSSNWVSVGRVWKARGRRIFWKTSLRTFITSQSSPAGCSKCKTARVKVPLRWQSLHSHFVVQAGIEPGSKGKKAEVMHHQHLSESSQLQTLGAGIRRIKHSKKSQEQMLQN